MNRIRHSTVDAGGYKVAIHESEGRGGHDVIFVSGNSTGWQSFEPLLNHPFAENYRCIVVDSPFSRKNPARDPEAFYSPNGWARFFHETARVLKLAEPVYVGWGFAGNCLLEGIAQGLYADASGFVIFGAAPFQNPGIQNMFQDHQAMDFAFARQLTRPQAEILAAAWLKPGTKPQDFLVEDILDADPEARACIAKCFAGNTSPDQLAIVAEMKKPFAVFHGENDQLINLASLKSLNLPNLWKEEILTISEAGHAAHFENPNAFAGALTSFIETAALKSGRRVA